MRLQHRANSLAFANRFWRVSASSTLSRKQLDSSILSQINSHGSARPGKMAPSHLIQDETILRHPIRSLIPSGTTPRIKTEPNKIHKRQSSSSSLSVKSFTSSIVSRKRKYTPTESLATMPVEILAYIFGYVGQRELHNLMLTNSNFIEVAASLMYFQPTFASTYRYAQFAWTVSHKEHFANMVRILDLSCFGRPRQGHGDFAPLAGWREFKFRHHDLYYVTRDRMAALAATTLGSKLPNSSHPTPSPFLKNFHRTRDLPIGGICHVLASCKKIR